MTQFSEFREKNTLEKAKLKAMKQDDVRNV